MTRTGTGTRARGAEPEVLGIRDLALLFKAGTPQVLSKQIQPGQGRSQAQILNRGPGGPEWFCKSSVNAFQQITTSHLAWLPSSRSLVNLMQAMSLFLSIYSLILLF